MKRIAVLMITIICFGSVFADSNKSNDERQKRWEEMKAKRAAFFTERICFTENEAQQFWVDTQHAAVFNEGEELQSCVNRASGCVFFQRFKRWAEKTLHATFFRSTPLTESRENARTYRAAPSVGCQFLVEHSSFVL